MVLEDASSDGIRFLGSRVHCLIKGGKIGSSFDTISAEFHVTADEDPTCSPWGRAKHIDVRHNLARDACDAGEVGVVCVRTRTYSKTLDTQKFHKHAKTVHNIVWYDSNAGVYCEHCELSYDKRSVLVKLMGTRRGSC